MLEFFLLKFVCELFSESRPKPQSVEVNREEKQEKEMPTSGYVVLISIGFVHNYYEPLQHTSQIKK